MPAAGSLSLAEENLAATLAASANARTWLSVADAAAARAKIYFHGLPAPPDGREYTAEELGALRPYAVIYTAERAGFAVEVDAAGVGYDFARSGQLVLRLYQNCPESYDDEPTSAANQLWSNTIGQIIDDLCDLSGQAGYLAFHRLQVAEGPFWSHPKAVPTQGLWQGVEMTIDWKGV